MKVICSYQPQTEAWALSDATACVGAPSCFSAFAQTEPWAQVPFAPCSQSLSPACTTLALLWSHAVRQMGLPSTLGIHRGISCSRVLGCFEWLFWISANSAIAALPGLTQEIRLSLRKPMAWISPQSGHSRSSAVLGCRMSRAAAFTWLWMGLLLRW